MKTTIELPDSLITDAKVAAARQRTTLKAIIEHALRRELYRDDQRAAASFTIDRDGLPVFQAPAGTVVTSQMVHEMMEELGI